jgi:phytoene desaturase
MHRSAGNVVVIGGGLGGLAAACHLAVAGRRVLVLEANGNIGGKCGRLELGAWKFDTGPSVLTMPFVLQELWRSCGRRLEDYLKLEPVEPGCRYFFPDGKVFDAPGNLIGLREAVAREFPSELEGFDRFFGWTRKLWDISEPFFLSNALGWDSFLRVRSRHLGPALALLRPGSMERAIRSCFRDPALIQMFMRFATYNGSDPRRTPAAFAVIAHAEFAFGSWRCVGGMYALAQALGRLAAELGVEIRTGVRVERVLASETGAISGVEVEGGDRIEAAAVVVNQDAVTAVTRGVLGGHPAFAEMRRRQESREASTGGHVLLLALDGVSADLKTHNIVFRSDYGREFRELFDERRRLSDPTLYISVPSHAEPGMAPAGGEGWFVLVNAPARPEPELWGREADEEVIRCLEAAPIRLDRNRIREMRSLTPAWFARELSAWRGSLYGPASNDLFAAFLRVRNASPVPGVAFVGGSAHPGGGIPLVLLGGGLAARSLIDEGYNA